MKGSIMTCQQKNSRLTYGVGLSRQLDAAMLQLLHPLLQVSLLLHEGGETLLELLHGSLQGLMNFHRHSSFWRKKKSSEFWFSHLQANKNVVTFSPECSWAWSQWVWWSGVWSCWSVTALWLWCCCSSLRATAACCLAARWSRCSSSSCLLASSLSASTWAKAPRINSSYGGWGEDGEGMPRITIFLRVNLKCGWNYVCMLVQN